MNYTGIRRNGGTESQSVVSVSNLPALNLRSLRSAFVVKVYVVSIVIRPWDGDVKPGGFFDAFR